MDEYFIRIKTDKNLGTEKFVRALLQEWYFKITPFLQLEYFDQGEPIRRKFEDEGIENAIKLWVVEKLPLMLSRKKKPKFVADIQWREEKGLDKRLFPWGCHVFLDTKAGDQLASLLFRFLVKHFEPAFGFLTKESDEKNKHFFSYKTERGIVEENLGTEIGQAPGHPPQDIITIPGLYWITFFGPWSISQLDEKRILNMQSQKTEKFENGFLITAYESSDKIGTPEGEEIEQKLIAHLGKEKFFNRSLIDLTKYR